jgi:polysaccharide pyruvyl transferase WcaK-like protein
LDHRVKRSATNKERIELSCHRGKTHVRVARDPVSLTMLTRDVSIEARCNSVSDSAHLLSSLMFNGGCLAHRASAAAPW